MSQPKAPVILLLVIFLFISPANLTAASRQRGEDLRVSLMIVGPGKPLYVWWGHIGLIVENERQDWSYFYDFGNFSFEEENFYANFAMGRLLYLKVKTRTEPYLRFLTWFDRRVTIYELNLTADEKEAVYDNLEQGVKPENRTYLYHHYLDNCSTRIRDVLDEAMGGEIRTHSREYAQSFRNQSNRFVRPFWAYYLLNYLQGSGIDKPIITWDALFLPRELEEWALAHIRPDGSPLVTKVRNQQDGIDPYIPQEPFPRSGEALLWGMLLFFITLAARIGQRDGLYAFWRVFSLIIVALPGVFLCFMMFFTDHHVTQGNLNALVTCPLLLIALVPATRYNREQNAPRLYERFWDAQALLVILSLLFKLLPGIEQDNGVIICLYLPLILAHGTPGTALVRILSPTLRIFPWSRKSA